MSKKKKSKKTDNRLKYHTGFPRTNFEEGTHSRKDLQAAITRDSTIIANATWYQRMLIPTDYGENAKTAGTLSSNVQVNREYLQKKLGLSDKQMLKRTEDFERGGKIGDKDLGKWKASYKFGGRTYKT